MDGITLNQQIADALRSLAVLCIIALSLKDAEPSSVFYDVRRTILITAGTVVAVSFVFRLVIILSRLL